MFKITKKPKDFIEIDLWDESYPKYGGFNHWIGSFIRKVFGVVIHEANISFHNKWHGFGVEHWYYDWYNHGIKLGFITIYWCGDPMIEGL